MSRTPPPSSHPAAAQVRPGWFVHVWSQTYCILPRESDDVSEVVLQNIETHECRVVSYIDLLVGHDDSSGPLFAASRETLQNLIDQRTTPPSNAPGTSLPPYAYMLADRVINTVQTIEAIMAERERQARVLGVPFDRTIMLRQVCGTLPEPVGISTYYKYVKLLAVCAGDRVQLAASFRRESFDRWQVTRQQLHFIDSLIARYYTREERPRPIRIYEFAQAHLKHTRSLWPDPKKCAGPIPRNLVSELLDRQIPMEAILANPEKAALLSPVTLPSRSWLYDYLAWFRDQPELGKKIITRQLGVGAWDEEHLSWESFVARAQFPLDIVVADHWLIDVFTVDEETRSKIRRLWLTVLIDVFTRCLIGFALLHEPPCIESIQTALRHAIFPKTSHQELGLTAPWVCCGTPMRLSLDNAWCHHSHSLERLANGLRLGGEFNPMLLLWRPPYKGRYGNVIESLFGNFSKQMQEFLPGALRSSAPKDIQNASRTASLLYGDVYKIIHQVILRYLHTSHSALHGMTPHDKWIDSMGSGYPLVPPLTPGVERLFWRMDPRPRQVTQHGIGAFGLHYSTDGLRRETGKDGNPLHFDISYEPSDISRLALFRGTTWVGDVYAKELKLADKTYLHISLAEHEISKLIARTDRQAKTDLLDYRDEVRALAQTRAAEKMVKQNQPQKPKPRRSRQSLPSDEDVRAAQDLVDRATADDQQYTEFLSAFSKRG